MVGGSAAQPTVGPFDHTLQTHLGETTMAKTKNKKKGTDKNKPAKTLKEKKQDKKDKKKGADQPGIFPE
jgi:hypothetical protein